MKNGHAEWFALFAGVVLLTGCGPANDETMPAVGPAEEGVSTPGIPSEYLEEGGVESAAICCNVRCSGKWYGPFRSVNYDLCAKFGRYHCPQRGLVYQGYDWRTC
ncbi:hypothetical protein [Corallococcus macrosporus]|uniref:Putative lipoprotein n=1 Tax=Myxococcus fulvus (strain ATCC BAA-855 / HW-1) TaxID=483219 RepID=F8C8G4_MYXFH|nr:hypothetical protein [Corallococcus macrosporus]AEI62010.1 putative lipoprotein [Corallococcus macrosporus]